MRYLSFGQRTRLIARQAKRGFHALADFSASSSYKPPAGVSLTPAMQRVRDSAYLALTRYKPRFYSGEIKFVRAAIGSGFPSNAAAVWRPLVEEITVETVPGDHLGMIATHYAELAAVLSRYLREAFAGSDKF
jgi:thioesterase domain-containing protein